MVIMTLSQVGPEDDGYRLSVTNFTVNLSTLRDSMQDTNGEKFSTRWESNDK